ncbi:hypothetical protein C8Q75DRAFT_582487 [Abortiporus biennis]|nr:hypothetical protein C8Q75DRAFT_582487 [Abortiporus biennis]
MQHQYTCLFIRVYAVYATFCFGYIHIWFYRHRLHAILDHHHTQYTILFSTAPLVLLRLTRSLAMFKFNSYGIMGCCLGAEDYVDGDDNLSSQIQHNIYSLLHTTIATLTFSICIHPIPLHTIFTRLFDGHCTIQITFLFLFFFLHDGH